MNERPSMPRPVALLAASIASLILFCGCEEQVNAVLDAEQAYSFYGYLNPRADTQAVRVFPIAPLLSPGITEPLDGIVTSTDLVTGETVAWRDSVVSFSNGTAGYVVYAPFRVEYGHRYRFSVRRSDGVESRVDVPVPASVNVERLEPFTRRFPNRILDAPYLPYEINGAVRVIQIRADYTFEVLNTGTTSMGITYDREVMETASGWRVELDLGRDQEFIRAELLRTRFMQSAQAQIELRWITFSVMIVNQDWNPPGGSFDPDVLVEPGLWSNVENGFGFVGGGYVEEFTLIPSGCYQFLAGFFIPEGNPCQ